MTTSKQELTRSTLSSGQIAPSFAGSTARPDQQPPRILRRILALDDFEDAARRVVPRPIFGYVTGGAETNASRRANREVWDELAFLPRVLVDTSARALKTTLFGHTYDAPFGIAPMGGTAMAAYQGDLVLARAAAAANVPMILSGASLTPLERVREAGPTAWFQAYLPGEAGPITELVERVARAGYDTFVLTVDVQVAANRENNVRSGFDTPLRPTLRLVWDGIIRPRWLFGMLLRTLWLHGMPHFENMGARVPLISRTGERERGRRDKLSWKHLELMRRLWKGRLVVKGILDKDDARIARESGVDGIIVSNHGGRQLDGAVARAARDRRPGRRDDRDDGQRRAARHRRVEGARARRAVRLRRPAVPLRGRDRRRAGRAARDQAAARRDRPRHGTHRHHGARRDAAGALDARARGVLSRR